MAVKKLKDDKGREYEVDIEDDDDDDDDGPFIDESDIKGLFDKWLGERESSKQTSSATPKKTGIRIKSSQTTPPTTTKTKQEQRTRRLRLA